MRIKRSVLLGGICLLMGGISGAVEPATDPLAVRPEAIEAWKDMRFGMFICWGLVSLTGLEKLETAGPEKP